MKVYNIGNGKEFLKELTACEGAMELSNGFVQHVRTTPGKQSREMMSLLDSDGRIRQMEIRFHNPSDCDRILSYLMNKRGLAA